MKDSIGRFFEKIPLDKVYEDLFQDGLKKSGEALATVLDLSNTILLPVKLLNEKSRIRFRINMEQYESNLNKIDKEKLCSVPEYVGISILDKLTYLNEDQLSKQFINLLTKASSTDTLKLVHPAFIKTLENLCSDEAKILYHYKEVERIPFIDIILRRYKEQVPRPKHLGKKGPKTSTELKEEIDYTFQDREERELMVAWNLTGIEHIVKINFTENIDIYIENLSNLGLIKFEKREYNVNDADVYKLLEEEIYKFIFDNY